jgi:hypothetical protein
MNPASCLSAECLDLGWEIRQATDTAIETRQWRDQPTNQLN